MKQNKLQIVKKAAPDQQSNATVLPKLGDCLRSIRFRKRLSIADVSHATGLARSTLSRVEKGQLSLTYDRLVQLCEGLQIELGEFLLATATNSTLQPVGRRTFTPPGTGKVVPSGPYVYHYLCTEFAGKHMTPMIAEIRARSFEEANGYHRHDGEEFTYVLQGTLELHTEFYEPLVIEAGGSVYFDGMMGHTYVAHRNKPVKILCVCSSARRPSRPPQDHGSRGQA
jgi:transcriptional regulator with XRE-family HTH domain